VQLLLNQIAETLEESTVCRSGNAFGLDMTRAMAVKENENPH
jgi:hypothetical protein